MERVAVPYPRPNIDDLDELLLKEIINGTMYKAVAQSISQGKQPFERWINLDDNIVDRLSKGKITLYDFAYENEIIDYPKLKEWSWLPYYVEKNFGADIVYNAKKYYTDFTYRGKQIVGLDSSQTYSGSPYIDGVNSGMLLVHRPKTNGNQYSISLYKINTNEIVSVGANTSLGTAFIPCDGFSFREGAGSTIEVFSVAGGLISFNIPSNAGQALGYPYSKYIYVQVGRTRLIYDQTGSLKKTIKNTFPAPNFIWKDRLFFYETGESGNETNTLIVNTKNWESKVIAGSRWYNFKTLGLYDFYQHGGAYRGSRYKYSLKKHGTLLPDTPFDVVLQSFDQYGDFQKTIDGRVFHTYDTNSFLFTGISFTLQCNALRFLGDFGSTAGYFGKICLKNTNGNYSIENELFTLYK